MAMQQKRREAHGKKTVIFAAKPTPALPRRDSQDHVRTARYPFLAGIPLDANATAWMHSCGRALRLHAAHASLRRLQCRVFLPPAHRVGAGAVSVRPVLCGVEAVARAGRAGRAAAAADLSGA